MTPTSSLIMKDALTETYQDIQNLIYDTVWKFKRANGGDFDDMISTANVIYMEAFFSYDASRASFSTWLHTKVWKGLLEYQRQTLMRSWQQTGIDLKDMPTPSVIPFCELLSELSRDARTIVELILELPDNVEQEALSKGTHPCHIRAALRLYLQTFLGWSEAHVVQTFQEIAEVIND